MILIPFLIALHTILSYKAIILDANNIQQTLSTNKFLGVMVYSRNSDICQSFMIEYEKQSNHTLQMALIDPIKNQNAMQYIAAEAIPSLILYIDKHPVYYKGPIKFYNFTQWADSILNITYKQITSLKQVGNETSIVIVSNQDLNDYICKVYSHITFYLLKGKKKEKVVLMNFPNIQKQEVELDPNTIEKHIKRASLLPLTFFNDEIAEITFKERRPTLFLFGDMRVNSTLRFDFILRVLIQSRNYTDILFARSNGTDRINAKLLYLLGVKESMMPCLMFVQMQETRIDKYILPPKNYSIKEVKEFIGSATNGTYPKYYKSDEGGPDKVIRHINGSNFHHRTQNQILVIFYTPFHYQSNHILKIASSLAKKTTAIEIGAYNIFANENEGMEFHQPVKLVLYSSNKSIEISNISTEFDLCRELNKHATVKITAYCHSGNLTKQEI